MFGKHTIIVFLGILAASKAIDPNNICYLVRDGTKITNDEDCASFWVCNGGKALAAGCPVGSYFSKDNQDCLPKAQVTCNADNTVNVCEGFIGEKFVSMPGSCSGYYHCSNSVASAGYCPGDLVFNPVKQVCTYKSEYGCTVGEVDPDNPDVLCAYIPNGVFFGSSADCKGWQKCTENKIKSGTCEPYVFNVQTRACDHVENYDCTQLEGGGEDVKPAYPVDCTAEGDATAYSNLCSGYLLCDGTHNSVMKCSGSQYFDTESKKCVTPQLAKNDCNRCEGNKKFVNRYQDGCTGYTVCSNGKNIGDSQCPEGQFFSEIIGACTSTNPEFPVCKNGTDTGGLAPDSDGSDPVDEGNNETLKEE